VEGGILSNTENNVITKINNGNSRPPTPEIFADEEQQSQGKEEEDDDNSENDRENNEDDSEGDGDDRRNNNNKDEDEEEKKSVNRKWKRRPGCKRDQRKRRKERQLIEREEKRRRIEEDNEQGRVGTMDWIAGTSEKVLLKKKERNKRIRKKILEDTGVKLGNKNEIMSVRVENNENIDDAIEYALGYFGGSVELGDRLIEESVQSIVESKTNNEDKEAIEKLQQKHKAGILSYPSKSYSQAKSPLSNSKQSKEESKSRQMKKKRILSKINNDKFRGVFPKGGRLGKGPYPTRWSDIGGRDLVKKGIMPIFKDQKKREEAFRLIQSLFLH
jgi:hypothetical protein